MRILITNISLRGRTGTETAVRDISINFARRGHSPIVFARRLGRPARELRSAGIPVVSDLSKIENPPDVIHGHHNIPTVAALVRFPKCPVIWVSRDTRYWFDRPPLFDRIHRYVAIDALRHDYLTKDYGIDPERVEILNNGVDLRRFPSRDRSLPDRPNQALAFTKTANEVPILDRACRQAGIAFKAIGRGAGGRTANPERQLVEADLVFATGRSAIEALCAGAAVIIADGRGLAGMVTHENYDQLRRNNFGRGAFDRQISAATIAAEIAKYDRSEALSLAQRIRADADLDKLLDRLEALYRKAIASGQGLRRWSDNDMHALKKFVADWPAKSWGSTLRWRRERREISTFEERKSKKYKITVSPNT